MFQAYSSGPKQEEREKVLWVKFEECDVNGGYSSLLHGLRLTAGSSMKVESMAAVLVQQAC